MTADDPRALIPKDPKQRARLARMAGLTEEEEAALNQWCAIEQQRCESAQRRGAVRESERPMA